MIKINLTTLPDQAELNKQMIDLTEALQRLTPLQIVTENKERFLVCGKVDEIAGRTIISEVKSTDLRTLLDRVQEPSVRTVLTYELRKVEKLENNNAFYAAAAEKVRERAGLDFFEFSFESSK